MNKAKRLINQPSFIWWKWWFISYWNFFFHRNFPLFWAVGVQNSSKAAMEKNSDSLVVKEKIMKEDGDLKLRQLRSRANSDSTSKGNKGSWFRFINLPASTAETIQIVNTWKLNVQSIKIYIAYIPSWRKKIFWIFMIFRVHVNFPVPDQNFQPFGMK